jgi:hypothetical protein
MVKLTPEQQHDFSKADPDAFVPAKGAWAAGDLQPCISRASARRRYGKHLPRLGATLPQSRSRSNFQKKSPHNYRALRHTAIRG